MRDAEIALQLGGEERLFRLAWGELEKLQEATDCGPEYLFARLTNGTWRMGDIAHTIRLGLIGGGMEANRAALLVNKHVKSEPPLRSLVLAIEVLGAGIKGAEDELPGEASAANQMDSTLSQTERSGSPPSTATSGLSAGLSTISDGHLSGSTPLQ